MVDKVEECKLAVRHLLGEGHRTIAFLLDKLDNSIRCNRLKGYRQALEEAGIPYEEDLVYIFGRDVEKTVAADESAEKGYLLTQAMLRRTPQATAFICMNDAMALGALKAVREAGKRVPGDYSMISFDDLVFADSVHPALTTVGLDKYTWGRKLAQYYFRLLEEPERKESVVKEEDVLVPSRLIVRQSTRRIGP